MAQIINSGNERPRRIDLGGVLMESGYFRSSFDVTIEKGDTLDNVARELGITPQSLYKQNRDVLGDDQNKVKLEVGQRLKYTTLPSRGLEIIF